MKSAVVCCTALLVSLGLSAASSLPATPADTYQVDPVHSSLIFRAKHFGVSYFYGRFNSVSGSFSLDDAEPAKSTFQLQVQAESIDTANAKRDAHLKSPDFFNAKQFPTIGFKSTQVKKVADDTLEVTGDLTLHGVTQSIKTTLKKTGTGKSQFGGQLAGVESSFTIKRSDFGMKFMLEGISDDVQITVSLEGGRK